MCSIVEGYSHGLGMPNNSVVCVLCSHKKQCERRHHCRSRANFLGTNNLESGQRVHMYNLKNITGYKNTQEEGVVNNPWGSYVLVEGFDRSM